MKPVQDSVATLSRYKTKVLAASTLVCALGIGYVMQYGSGDPAAAGPVGISDIQLTSSGVVPPAPGSFPSSVRTIATQQRVDGAESAPSDPSCAIDMQAAAVAGAMVEIRLSAPCNSGERITLHHQGMTVTEQIQTDGSLSVTIPALSETAVFMAEFAGGTGATAVTNVSSLAFYDRVALQWRGSAGLQLHALEYGSDYFSDGHIWASSSGDMIDAARGEGGFLMRIGQEDAPDSLVAEVYSFPVGAARRAGQIALSVEAEITGTNCGSQVEAQTLQVRDNAGLRIHDLLLALPDCSQVGDFLVLKNIFEDLTIAGR